MLKFNIKPETSLPLKIPNKYPDVLEYNVLFEIETEEGKFFEEPEFPIYEFILSYDVWKRDPDFLKKDFIYTSLETEENSLIKFKYEGCGWKILSPWELFSCEIIFTDADINKAFVQLKENILKYSL